MALAQGIGDFIRYWGFRRIHGEAWTLIYLSPSPVSGAELTRRLQVSKALMSPALQELEAFGLIARVGPATQRSKRYIANPDVFEVIKGVLKQRELKLLERIHQDIASITQYARSKNTQCLIDAERLTALVNMIGSAHLIVQDLVALDLKELLGELPSLLQPSRS